MSNSDISISENGIVVWDKLLKLLGKRESWFVGMGIALYVGSSLKFPKRQNGTEKGLYKRLLVRPDSLKRVLE